MDWPTGIRPRGKGLEITIWKGRKRIYSKIIKCDPHKPSNLASAIKHRNEKLARLETGLPLGNENDPLRDLKIFQDVAQAYLNSLQISPGEIKLQTRYLNHYWMPKFAYWPVAEISRPHIKEILADMNVKIQTQQNRLLPLKGVLDHAELHPNPATGIRWPKAQRRQQKVAVIRYLPDERDKIIKALNELYEEATQQTSFKQSTPLGSPPTK